MDDITRKITDLTKEPSRTLVEEIKTRHQQAGQVATGRTSALLRIEPTATGFNLVGWQYSGTYEEGRKPGKMPNPDALVAWAKAKGITFKTEAQARSFGWALAKKIAREGTERYRLSQQGKPVDIFRTPIANMRQTINEQIVFYLSHDVIQTLLRSDLQNK